jgi:hypothetical protein
MVKVVTCKTLLLAIGLFVIGISPIFSGIAFAITYTDADNPSGPLQVTGWVAGLAVAAALSGMGVWTAVRRR